MTQAAFAIGMRSREAVSFRYFRIGSAAPGTVDSWLLRWGGEQGAAEAPGRVGYLNMQAVLKQRAPSEAQLKEIMDVLVTALPS